MRGTTIRTVLLVSLMTVALCSCSMKETNELIAQANADRFTAFTTGMNEATSEGARIAMAMAFAGGMGMQEFYRPETGSDYLRAGLPWATLAFGFWANGGTGDKQDMKIQAGRDVLFQSSKQDSFMYSPDTKIDGYNVLSSPIQFENGLAMPEDPLELEVTE